MGEKKRAHRSLRIRALLLAALMLCAMLPAGRASGMNFTFDLGTVESFDNAETPKPTATPVVTEAPVQQTMEMPEDIPL